MSDRYVMKFGKYSVTAVLSAVVDWVSFTIITLLFQQPLAAQAIGRVAGGLFAFFCNRRWSFSDQDTLHLSIQGRRFVLLYGVSYVQSLGIFYLLSSVLAVDVFVSKLIADGSCFVTNFVIMKFYVFGKTPAVITKLFRPRADTADG